MSWEKYKVDVPEGMRGDWHVKRIEVSKQESEAAAMRALFARNGRGILPPGGYTQLRHHGRIIMSDTPDEIRDHLGFMRSATGDVLIAGLGIGMVLDAVAKKDEVKSVTIIEKSEDVIYLMADHYRAKSYGEKLTIIEDDIFTWKPPKGVRWHSAWFDIWDDLCTDNLAEMATLHRRFGRRTDHQDSWGKAYLRMRRDQERREMRSFRY